MKDARFLTLLIPGTLLLWCSGSLPAGGSEEAGASEAYSAVASEDPPLASFSAVSRSTSSGPKPDGPADADLPALPPESSDASACCEDPPSADLSAPAAPISIDRDWQIDTALTLGLETSFNTGNARRQKMQLQLEPKVEIELPSSSRLTFSLRGRFDTIDDIEPGQPSQENESRISRRLILGDTGDLEIRELNIQTQIGPAFVTAGKQFIVWGKSDGLKVLDLVNPQSFREFILPDFEDSRIPLWSVNADIPLGPALFTLVWLPDPTYNELPDRDALYAFTSPLIAPQIRPGTRVRSPDRPRRIVADSDIGFRLSGFYKGWDLTLNYLYHYDDELTFPRTGPADGSVPIEVRPRYRRTNLVGGSFSTAFGQLVVRGEGAFRNRRTFNSLDLVDSDGIVESSEVSAVLGFDWSGIESTLISLQIFQSWIANDARELERDQSETRFTLLVRRTFLNDRLTADFIWLRELNRSSGLLRPRIRYTLRDNLEIFSGFDIFHGSRRGIFGQFGKRDRFSFGLEWTL
jgi:hypothetical protein